MEYLPKFKPSLLEVNNPALVKIMDIRELPAAKNGIAWVLEIERQGKRMDWIVSDSTYQSHKHLFVIGDIVSILKHGPNPYDVRYAAAGDISQAPQNIPEGHNPLLNTRQIAKKAKTQEDQNMARRVEIWRGQSLNLTMEHRVKKGDSWDVVRDRWAELYRELGPEMLYGFDAAAKMRSNKKTI